MFDRPSADKIIAEVATALKAGVPPGFEQLVAANALGIAERELTLGPKLAQGERTRLQALLGSSEGDLPALRQQLADAIRAGTVTDETALAAHLVRTAIAKMQIDQPRYAAFRQWQAGQSS